MNKKLCAAIVISVVIPFGCSDRVETIHAPTPHVQKVQDVPIPQSVEVRPADSAECSNGGIVYTVYVDVNLNASFDKEDSVVKSYPVCNGSNGSNGQDGSGVAFAVLAASSDVCVGGGSTILMAKDVNNSGVYSVTAPNQQAMTICNGQSAQMPSYTPVDVIHACGDNVPYKEVLLVLSNGKVLGSFSNDTGGTMTRLAFLSDGTFMNTDNSGCVFSLSTSGDGKTRSISWSGNVQKTWSVSQ